MYDWLVELHTQNTHLLKALLAGTLVSSVCGVVGCFIILRRMSFLADALAHSMLAGVVCGYLIVKLALIPFRQASGVDTDAYGPSMLIGSLIAGVITVLLVGFVSRFSRIKEDAVIGIMYTGIFALGGVLLSYFSHHVHIDVLHFLTGDLLAIRNAELWMMAIVVVVVLGLIVLFYRPLQLITFDRVMAASLGIPVLLMDYMLTACTSLVVVSGVNVVGVILVVGLLIIPAGTAYLLCDRLHRMLWMSALFGFTSFVAGYLWAERINVAPGSAVVVASVAQFFVVLAVAPRYGLLADVIRRRRMVPQATIEDVLSTVYRAPDHEIALSGISRFVDSSKETILRALRQLSRQGLLVRTGEQCALTEDGQNYALRLVRAHRLWETYLEHMGTPLESLHEQAHKMEHVHDEQAVDYLDDKLGHPLRDPHGSEIPEDFVHLVPGAVVPAAMLREGHHGVVVNVDDPTLQQRLPVGVNVVAGPRRGHDDVWTLQLPDGNELELQHQQADAIQVKLGDAKPQGSRDSRDGVS